MTHLRGRRAIVTGASSGIGETLARSLAKEGTAVALIARRRDRLEAIANDILAQGGQAFIVEADLTESMAADVAVERSIEMLGGIDLAINAAGVMHLGRFVAQDPADWKAMVDLNLNALLAVTQSALRPMLEKGFGDIVNVSSVSGRAAAPLFSVYSATKFAVQGFTEALRQELAATDIRIMTVAPGATKTEIGQYIRDPEVGALLAREMAGVTQLVPDDIARAVIFALSQPREVAINDIVVRPTRQSA